jgi:FKBP-type peptidyl-prolyl cis-trans isomerase 2
MRPSRRIQEAKLQDMLAPGALVRHPKEPDWGIGQVQTVIGARVTVNFEHAGKRLINSDIVRLELVASERDF